MGQKVNPIGLRLGINRTWDSRWFANDREYGDLLHEDLRIRRYIHQKVGQAGISKVIIERPAKKARITIHTARPGVVIGKKGADIERLRKELALMTDSELHLNIVESGLLVGGANGIGTTFSAARVLNDMMIIAHVGDSSVFLKNGQGLQKISCSHTLADELIEKHGSEAMNDIPEHYKHTLTRCMGQDIDFSIDVATHTIKQGDGILICSDGITNMIDEDVIDSVMEGNEPQDFVPALIDLANQNGGVDNSTVVAFVVN